MAHRAIGSSYLIRQVAGSERLGGLRVTLYPRSDSNGKIDIQLTDWHTGEQHEYPMQDMVDAAFNAMLELADEHSFDLSQLDIKLDRFVFHDLDSDPRCYVQAARSAFRSALESLQSNDAPFGVRRNW